MDHRDDQRTEELNSLRLALATFALQLDAFEARLKGRHAEPSKPISPDIGFAKQVIGAMKNRPAANWTGDLGAVPDHEGSSGRPPAADQPQ
jgi:hypothetical protein